MPSVPLLADHLLKHKGSKMPFPFSDLPDCERFRLRNAIEEHGGDVECYCGGDVQLVLPWEWRAFVDELARQGLKMVPGSRHYFPLGSDCNFAPSHQRHDGPYPGSRGYWCLARFNVPDFCPI